MDHEFIWAIILLVALVFWYYWINQTQSSATPRPKRKHKSKASAAPQPIIPIGIAAPPNADQAMAEKIIKNKAILLNQSYTYPRYKFMMGTYQPYLDDSVRNKQYLQVQDALSSSLDAQPRVIQDILASYNSYAKQVM